MGGKPTLDAVIDSEIEEFYTKGCVDCGSWDHERYYGAHTPLLPFLTPTPHPPKHSNKTWEARNFSIITGPTAELAQACGLLDPEESLFMSTTTPDYYKGTYINAAATRTSRVPSDPLPTTLRAPITQTPRARGTPSCPCPRL